MKTNLLRKGYVVLATFAVCITCALGAPYEAGETVAPFTAKDQHGAAFTFEPKSTRYLLVSHDMDTGKKANAVLNALGKEYLPGKKAIFVSNIEGMPTVGRMFALPKMRKYSHRIILGEDAGLIARFPQQQGTVTVLTLVGGKVQSIAYWTPGTDAIDTIIK